MLEKGQNWELFGYDMRHLGRYWSAAWRDVLWSYDSPVRSRLDEVVSLRSDRGVSSYQAGGPLDRLLDSDCKAVLLTDELVLCKQINVPAQAEGDLDSMLELEVGASSPFAAADTRWGWTIVSRNDSSISVALAIVSASAAMTFLGREYDSHDSRAQEVWAQVDGEMVVIRGFGEHLRERRYRKRLLQSLSLITLIVVLSLAMAGAATLFKNAELQRLEKMAGRTTAAAGEASRLRSLLAVASETIGAANEVVVLYPNPHTEIARLTRLLGDEASISSFSMSGPEIRLRGRAADAALVMEEMTDEPAYLEVTSGGITKIQDGREQFQFTIRIGEEVPE